MAKRSGKVDAPLASRLHWAYIERWLKKNGVPLRRIERQEPFWQTAEGRKPLKVSDIERLISIDDPVAWAWLNLTERDAVRDEETGKILTPAGSPWALFPVQAEMARIKGNLIVECGAEVGKTRDIILGTLWECDTWAGGASDLIAADSDITLEEIWSEIEFQLGQNPMIGGGVVDSSVKPFREKVFANGARFQMRLCGHDGKQFRGGHFAPGLRADEAAKWKNAQQYNELWRAGKPGSHFRIYSTPDGDYSSPFYALCERAVAVGKAAGGKKPVPGDEPKFKKFNISKMQLPPPFWTEARAAKYREQYGGENSVGWQTNVLGRWGSPSYSVFPMPTLKPNLKYLAHYRVVVALIDRERGRVQLRAARLSPDVETVEGGRREEMLLREERPMLDGKDLGQAISAFFPDTADWTDPLLYCGGDLGSATDPTELVFVRRTGLLWADVFRLHLENADWPVQADIIAALDHASGHRVRYGFDNGSAGSALVQVLTQMEAFRSCPSCKTPVFFSERIGAFGFGDHCDEIDVETGETIPNPDKKNAAGTPLPHRLSNKEFSTRVLERKMQAKQLAIANDAGAEDQRIAAAQLLVNHTYSGTTSRGERRFKGQDDHHVDARRQVALVIASAQRGTPFISPDPADLVRVTATRRTGVFDEPGSVAKGLDVGRVFGGVAW
jgi:hypothetical protein